MTTRRRFLVLAGGALASAAAEAQLPPNIEALRKAALQDAVRKATGGAQVRRGRVKLDVPPLIDNGNTVPLSVEVESPMTGADHVRAIHVFTEKNPQPYVITAHLGPRAGRARISTGRASPMPGRCCNRGDSDGSFWSDSVSES
jgi:sulfur-oxidizing protein SoxY